MLERDLENNIPEKKRVSKLENPSMIGKDKYVSFFDYTPIALFIEDFSEVKKYIDKVISENNTSLKSYIENNPSVIPKLVSLVKIKDVNVTAVELYKAKSKRDLFQNLHQIFTKKSNEGFSKLIIDVLLGEKETELETINKTLEGDEFDILIKFKVLVGSEDTLDNIIVSVEDFTEKIKARKALAESENRYKESQEIAKIGSWFYDFKTNTIEWTYEAFRMFGVEDKQQKLSKDFYLSFVHIDDRNLVDDFSINNLLKNPNQKLKYRIFTQTGELKYIYEKRSVIIEHNKILRIIGIAQDITESVLAEQKLSTSKNLLSKTLSGIQDGFVILDYSSNYLYVNNRAEEILNKPAEELIGKHIWDEFPEKEGDLFFEEYQKALKTREPRGFENYFEPWGKWFENRIIPSKDGMLLFFHEITAQKTSEIKINKAYNIINKSSSVAVLCKNERDFPIEFASENAEKLFGYTHNEFLLGKAKIHHIVHPEDLPKVRKRVFEISKSEKSEGFRPNPFRIVTKNGEVKWIEARIDSTKNDEGEVTHIQGIVDDVTERKKNQDLFIESSQRLKDQFNNTPLASIMWDLDFKILEWNNSAERIFGYSADEIIGEQIEDLLTPPHLMEEMKILRKTLFIKDKSLKNTNENITKSGRIITCDWYSVTLRDSQGKIIGTACLVDDITERIASKKMLQRSEKKYKDIFKKSIDAVLIIKEGLFSDCNEATLKMFGHSSKAALLKIHPSQISPKIQPDGSESFLKAEEVMKVAIEKGSNRFRWFHKRENGHVFPAEVSLTNIEENDNRTTIHAVVRDITERVKNEKIESVLYNISNAALTINNFSEFCLLVKNELHKIIDTNNFYIALYNEENNTISTPFIIDDFKFEANDLPAKGTLTGYVIKTKKSLIVKDNDHQILVEKGKITKVIGPSSKVWVGVPLKGENNVFGAIAVQSYISEDAYSESDVHLLELVANQISATIQIKNTQSELKKALEKAQESDRLKSAFLANMSHEIRTPMNGIIGFSELSLNLNLSSVKRQEYANIVINSSRQLLSIVNDILDISKIEAGIVDLSYTNVNINNQLNDLFAFYNPIAIEKGLQLKCEKGLIDEESNIEIDKTKLNQILINLISNAFKFTDKGFIEFGYQLINTDLQFYVKDTGVGIDEKLQHKIFDRFTQADVDLNTKNKGTGLGLAISKKFIELFKGKTWLDSSGKGTTIYFTIPYKKSKFVENTLKDKKQNPNLNVSIVTILVAEDEEYNMLYLNELFSGENIKMIEAQNGLEAVELANKHPDIDMVFMDIKMPIMNGNEAMLKIKKLKPNLPIIALSAFAMESDKETALNNGFDSYLSKPIDRKKLFKVISEYSN